MKTLANLKLRLVALPGIRQGRQHEACYASFLDKAIPAKESLGETFAAIANAQPVLPAAGYADARRAVRNASSVASRLRQKLTEEPASVIESKIEESFTRLFENAQSGLRSCKQAWESELQNKIKDWETIAEVVAKLMRTEGTRLKSTINSLRAAKGKLPLTKKDATEVQAYLEDLRDSVSKLGLETAFGKFLQSAASPFGADLSAAQETEVSNMITKHKLDKVFRIRLST